MVLDSQKRFYWYRSASPPSIRGEDSEQQVEIIVGEPSFMGYRAYEPLAAESGLWLEFARIADSPDHVPFTNRILDFAEAYGPLGVTSHVLTPVVHESLAVWSSEAQKLALAAALWRACFQDFNQEELVKNLKRHEWAIRSGLVKGNLTAPSVAVAAAEAIRGDINEAFARHGVRLLMEMDAPSLKLSFDTHPGNLLGCMWLQFARAVEGNKVYHQCEACSKFFEVGSNRSARSDKRFCTPTCKANAHRRLKQEVVSLASQGMSASEIARRTGKDVTKITEWIKS